MRELGLLDVNAVAGGNGPVCPPTTTGIADGIRDWGPGTVGVGLGVANTGAVVSQLDTPGIGPMDALGGGMVVVGGGAAIVGGVAYRTGCIADSMDQSDEQAASRGCPPNLGGSGGSGDGGSQKNSIADYTDRLGRHAMGF